MQMSAVVGPLSASSCTSSLASASWSHSERWGTGAHYRPTRPRPSAWHRDVSFLAAAEVVRAGHGGPHLGVVGCLASERRERDELLDDHVAVPLDPLEAPADEDERLTADYRAVTVVHGG